MPVSTVKECYGMWDVSQDVVYVGFSPDGVLQDVIFDSGCGICRFQP